MSIALYIIFAQIAVGWWFIQYLLAHQRGPKASKRMLWFAGVLGIVAVAIAFGFEWLALSPKLDPSNPKLLHQLSTLQLAFNCLLIGVIEELAKALPLTLFIYKKRYFNKLTDGIIYYGIAGMVFGVIESVGYTLSLGIGAGIAKIITGPFTHASLSVLIGYSVARYKLQRKRSFWTIVIGLAAAIGLHGLYDFGLFTATGWGLLSSMIITVVINGSVFVLFAKARRIDAARGLGTIGNNLYCRSCGWPNPKHFMFCVQCGKRT